MESLGALDSVGESTYTLRAFEFVLGCVDISTAELVAAVENLWRLKGEPLDQLGDMDARFRKRLGTRTIPLTSCILSTSLHGASMDRDLQLPVGAKKAH
jgi:hypothetical protein